MDSQTAYSTSDDGDGALLPLVFILMQWLNRRNVATMAMIQAASTVRTCEPPICSTLLLLAGIVLHSMSLTADVIGSLGRQVNGRRRLWVVEQSGGVWKDLQRVGAQHDKVFKRFCRLPRPLFNEILLRIAPYIQFQKTNWRQPVPAGQKLACAIIRWATGDFYRQTAHGLGLGLCSALRSNEEVADALIKEYDHLISFPTRRRLQEVLYAFKRKGFPRCVGAIDDTHIYIEKPRGERSECYYDRTGQFFVQVQVVCDHECRIFSVYVGCPGSVHDSLALRLSRLYTMAREGSGVFGTGSVVLRDGRTVGRYLLGNAGYPLLPCIMIPGWRGRRTEQQRMYDGCHTSARSCIERTFRRLKAKWRHLYGDKSAI
ncbi:hypothetical protein CBR_g55066 [Chara braunii]|uniref:DDE Tnp4 domain-containing protein n=1 Tax=Chara braunii TaxID=69332 RepID=A0A388MCL0_CHABU|nr:hypothetical protein CBR_g55066 [Chara braunii]|eukprot:GBG92297.1 hypothetical protein CBR_g55066 [Chara braunii]